MDTIPKLNLKQQKFIEHYLLCGNATEAVIRAGYKGKHVAKYAHELLNKPQIKAELEKTRKLINASSVLTVEYKLELLLNGILQYSSQGEFEKMGKLLEITNKIQGHIAPVKSISTISLSENVDMVRDLTERYMNESNAR